MILLKNELYLLYAKYKSHIIQYTLLFMLLLAFFVYGVYYRIGEFEVTNYERITLCTILYFLMIIRIVTNGFTNIFNEFYKEKYQGNMLGNGSISYYSESAIITIRVVIKSLFSLVITIIAIACIANLCNASYSYNNYILLFLYGIISLVMLIGLGAIYISICNFFDLQKEVSLIVEMILILFFVMTPMDFNILPTSLIKQVVYGVFFDDVVMCIESELFTNEFVMLLCVSLGVFALGLICSRISIYMKAKRRWKDGIKEIKDSYC